MSNLSQFALPVKDPSTGEISNQTFNLPNGGTWVGTCASAANEQHKVVTVDEGFVLEKGVRIAVKFSKSNTFVESSSARITFNVNNTGAKQVYYGSGTQINWVNSDVFGAANQYGYYIYDGTYWVWDGHNKDNNTSSVLSVAELKAGTSTSSRVVRPDYLHQGISEMIDEGTSGKLAVYSTSGNIDSLAQLWELAESKYMPNKMCLIRCYVATEFGIGTGWFRLYIAAQNLIGNGSYDITGTIIKDDGYRLEFYTVRGGKDDSTNLVVNKIWTSETDSAPTSGSKNSITSGAVANALLSKANSADLAEVATSGSFNDLTDVPAFPTAPTELVVNVAANATSASFTSEAITSTATYDVYTSVFTNLTGMSISGTTLTVNFKAVSSAMQVKLRIS